jgi:hypothetical protein
MKVTNDDKEVTKYPHTSSLTTLKLLHQFLQVSAKK